MTSSQDTPAAAPAEQQQNPENAAENAAENAEAPEKPSEEASDKTEETSDKTEEPPKKTKDGVFLAPHGNALGNKIESGLSPIGKPLGKGFGVIASPVGGLVEPLVGGLLKSGGAYGEAAGVGAGNMDKEKAEEQEKKHAPVGGQEQTGENPLGLS